MQTSEPLHAAVAKAVSFFEETQEPHALLWLEIIHQSFRVEEFADALQRYDDVLIRQPPDLPLLRVLRRMADPDNPLQSEDFQAVTHPSDLIVAYALYCNQQELPPVYPNALYRAAHAGGYYLTHVLLAWVWIQRNGCELALQDGFIEDVFRATAMIVNADPTIVSDLRLEAAAYLYLAGQGALIDDVFVESVVASQNVDGGWGKSRDEEGGSDWHATILGLLLLLHVKFADSSAS